MKKAISLVFAAITLLQVGCSKPSPGGSGIASNPVTDWGVLEVVSETPKHLNLEGEECTLTATPYLRNQIQLFIESKQVITDQKTGARTNKSWSASMIVPANVEYTGYVGQKLVRFTLKFKQREG